MSRVSRYVEKNNVSNSKEWNVALYMRLSRCDDEDDYKNESESIASQKALLNKFAMSNPELKIYDYYIDDGYSGTSFDRPAFNRMWQDIRAGKVNCVAVKDLSRFGRNTIETDNYLEVIFPTLKIRFISLLENVDTFLNPDLSNQKLLIAFKNLMNDEYARDLSMKVRTANAAHRRKGDFIGSFAPYGYKKDPENHHKLIVDEEVAQAIKEVYRMYLSGFSIYKVSREMNKTNFLPPAEYKKKNGCNLRMPSYVGKYHLWSPTTIKKILTDEVYIGNMVQGKRCVISYKNTKKISKSKEEWDIVNNTHEPIISKEDFEKAKNLIELSKRPKIQRFRKIILSGLVRCGDCDKSMSISQCSSKKLKGKFYYKCSTFMKNPELCSKHSIRNDVLENIVFEILKKYIKLSVDIDNLIKLSNNKNAKSNNSNEKLKCDNERKILSNKQQLTNLYLSFKNGKVAENEYYIQKEKIEKDILYCENQINKISSSLNNNEEIAQNNFITSLKKFKNFTYLTQEMAQELIEVIYVYENKEIDIKFKFQDEFEIVMNYLQENSLI